MHVVRLCLYAILLLVALTLGAYLFAVASSAQTRSERELKPDVRGAERQRLRAAAGRRTNADAPDRGQRTLATRPRNKSGATTTARRPARVVKKDGATNIKDAATKTQSVNNDQVTFLFIVMLHLN